MDEKETNIHEPNGIPSKTVGHVDKDSRIYQDGREIGYVDRDKQVHVPDDIFYRGKVVGQIKNENKAYSKDEFMVQSKEWGYVDEDGNIRQKDSGRIVGKMRGDNRAGALGYYMLRFKNLEERVDQLEQSVYSDSNKVKYLDPVRKMLDYVPNANALGDFDILISRLRRLEGEIISAQAERRYKKEELCRRVEFLSNSTDWKATHVALVELQEKWKEIGFTGKEFEDTLWRRFRSAQDKFYQRRQAYFEELNRKREENRKKKEVLCSEAESLSTSTDWKATSERMKELQAQWKEIGSAGRKYEDDLWRRFRSAQDRFFERRNSFYEKFKSELKENLRRKEHLCESAESLTSSNDLKSAKEEIKVLQAEWKEIGHVPREYVENLWQRFRKACDEVFERAREEYERKHAEWRSNLQDAIERKRQQIKNLSESVAHDEGLVERWQDTINNLYDGGKADEIRDSLESKISDVEDKIRSKESRISELQDAIQDMESKLR